MISLRDAFRQITASFTAGGMYDPRRQAEELLMELLALPRVALVGEITRFLSEDEWKKALEWHEKRLQGCPLAYISGEVLFYGCRLRVTPSVLIPRQETEILVDHIAADLKQEGVAGKELWDVCSGSGCMGIALKRLFPELHVVLSDLSVDALAIAAKNAQRNHITVECLEGDLLAPFHNRRAHFVVCNPPYISEEEYENLEKEVKNFEPSLALALGVSNFQPHLS